MRWLKWMLVVPVAVGLWMLMMTTRHRPVAVIPHFTIETPKPVKTQPSTVAAEPFLERMQHTDVRVRAQAMEWIAFHRWPQAVPALREALTDSDATIRLQAIVTLGHIGPPAREAIGDLMVALETATLQLRLAIVESLIQIDREQFHKVRPILEASLTERDPIAVSESIRILAGVGPMGLPILTKAFPKSETNTQLRLARAFGQIGKDAKDVLPELRKSTQSELRIVCVGAIIRIQGEADVRSLDVFRDVMKSGDDSTRLQLASEISDLAKSFASVRPLLLALLNDANPAVVVRALDGIVEDFRDAKDTIRRLWKSPNPRVVWAACSAFHRIARDQSIELESILVALLREPSPVQVMAAELLVQIAPDAEVIPRLRWVIEHRPLTNRIQAARLLAKLGDESAIEHLRETIRRSTLRSSDGDAWIDAIDAIAQLGERGVVAVPDLIDAAKSPSPNVQSAVARAFGTIRSPECIPTLQQFQWSTNPNVRRAAMLVLQRFDAKIVDRVVAEMPTQSASLVQGQTVEFWRDALNHPSSDMRCLTLQRLHDLNTNDAVSLLPCFIERMHDNDAMVKVASVSAMASIRPLPSEVLATLWSEMPNAKGRYRVALIEAVLRHDSERTRELQPLLAASLQDGDKHARLWAAKLLWQIDPSQGPNVLSALRLLSQDVEFRTVANELMQQIKATRE